MRLYLSSFRTGDHPEQLVDLMDNPGPVAVIANSIDGAAADGRAEGVQLEIDAMRVLGLDADEVDLREHVDDPAGVAGRLAAYRMLWVRGGNAFTLLAAMQRSGADVAVVDLLHKDAVVYAGYSAGGCVLAPSLRGLELVDHPEEVTRLYGVPPSFDGLGVLDYAFVPHFESPGHPETDDIGKVAAHYRRNGVAHRTLRDGQAIVVNGADTRVV